MRSTLSLSSGKGKGSSSPRDGCLTCGGTHFQRDCNARKNTGKQSSGKGKQSKSWSKSEGKGKSKENKGKSKGNCKGTIGAKGSHKDKTSKKLVSQVLRTRNQRQARTLKNLHRHVPLALPGTMVRIVTNGMIAGVLMTGMMTGVLLGVTKAGNKRMTLPQTHSHLEVWILVPPVVRSGLNG